MPITSDIKGFLSKDTAGLPNWGWIVVIGAGIAAAYFIPKFLNKGSTDSSTPTTGQDTTGSGIGLAIDPTTGLPYAVEGLVPSGAMAGGGAVTPTPTPTPKPKPKPKGDNDHGKSDGDATKKKEPPAKGKAPAPKPAPQEKFVTVTKWPSPEGTLSGIASKNGISLARLEQLNPGIKNPNLIYPGQKVRVA